MEIRKDYAVQMRDITIKFGSYTALDRVQLDVKKGSIHAAVKIKPGKPVFFV